MIDGGVVVHLHGTTVGGDVDLYSKTPPPLELRLSVVDSVSGFVTVA